MAVIWGVRVSILFLPIVFTLSLIILQTDTATSLDQLSHLLHLTPSLENLNLRNNYLQDLPASFVHALISLPKLKTLDVSKNLRLGCNLHPSTPCAIHRLLSTLYTAALPSPLILRNLDLQGLEMTAECCGPILERMLYLGPRGLQSLDLRFNPALSPHFRTLVRTISNDNFFIQGFEISGLNALEWEEEEERLEGKCFDTLDTVLERNRRLEKETHEAAWEILKVSRVLLLGSSGPSPPANHTEPRARRQLLGLPPELLQMALSFMDPPALSARQIISVVHYAADRTTLLLRPFQRETLDQQAPEQGSFDLQRLPFQQNLEFLMHTGCDHYHRWRRVAHGLGQGGRG